MSNLSGHGQLTGVMRSSGGSGGGSEVIINPSGAAIGTMEKISVDGDIYEVRNVPDATSASNGDVLTRNTSGVGWNPPTKELPVYTSSDNDKVLSIDNDTLTWVTIPKELPNILTSDEGKVLTVSNGAPAWQDAGGGGVKKDLLWEYTDSYNITLSSPFIDYDFLIFEGNNYRDTVHKGGAIVSSNLLDSIAGVSGKVYTFNGAIGEFANYNVVSGTRLTYIEGNARVLNVWGIKF